MTGSTSSPVTTAMRAFQPLVAKATRSAWAAPAGFRPPALHTNRTPRSRIGGHRRISMGTTSRA
jgi:hypothetical protein